MINLEEARAEMDQLLPLIREGHIWQEAEFSTVPLELRRFNDIAFSGNGEPTTYPRFSEAVQLVVEARSKAGYTPEEVKIVLITNATQLHRPQVQAGLRLLDKAKGEIWAKLDAGTPEYYSQIDRTNVPYKRVLNNILETARQQPLNIQTCMMCIQGVAPSVAEIEAYCKRLTDFLDGGGQIKMVQLYTVARRPPHQWVTSLPDTTLNAIAEGIKVSTGLAVETYGGNIGVTSILT